MPIRPPKIEDIRNFEAEQLKPKKKTTSKETWKLFERNVSKDFKTTRTPLSGMVKTITNSDTLHPKIYVECKLRGGDKEFKFWKLFEDKRTGLGVEIMEIVNDKNGELIWLMTRDNFLQLMEMAKFELNLVTCVLKSKVYRSVLSLYRETMDRAEIENKIPVVAIKKKNMKSYLIGTHPKQLVKLHEILKKK